jgi:hypothetical protein
MRYLLPLLFAVSLAHAEPVPWRAVWEWSCPKRTEADLTRIADQAKALGFNVIMMSPPAKLIPFMSEQCHQRGMKLYLSTVFVGGDKSWQQVMTPAEQERAKLLGGPGSMSGGEPILPGEVFNTPLPCYGRPEVHDYFRKKVIENAKLAVDGLAFDYTGYQNYQRCYCPACAGKDPLQVLVDFTNDMARAARQANPKIELTVHIYPWFACEPYWGHRTDIDYVGQTVSWFFTPHWPLTKVNQRLTQLIRDQHTVYPQHYAAPFIGFDATKPQNYRSTDRMRRELQLIKSSGAQALQVAELGYLLHKPLVAEAVACELGGTYRAPDRR